AILGAVSRRWRWGYAILAVATFLNMYVVLTTLYPGNPLITDWLGIGPLIRSQPGVTLVAVLNTIGFGWVAWQLRPAGTRAIERDLSAAAADEEASSPRGMPAGGPVTTAGWTSDASLAPRPVRRPVAGSWISGSGAGPAVADASLAADPPSWPTADPD